MKIWTNTQRNQNVDNQYKNMNLFLFYYFLLFFLHVPGFLQLSKEKNRSDPDVEFYDSNQNAFYDDCNKKVICIMIYFIAEMHFFMPSIICLRPFCAPELIVSSREFRIP